MKVKLKSFSDNCCYVFSMQIVEVFFSNLQYAYIYFLQKYCWIFLVYLLVVFREPMWQIYYLIFSVDKKNKSQTIKCLILYILHNEAKIKLHGSVLFSSYCIPSLIKLFCNAHALTRWEMESNPPPLRGFCPILKKSWDDPYPKILILKNKDFFLKSCKIWGLAPTKLKFHLSIFRRIEGRLQPPSPRGPGP